MAKGGERGKGQKRKLVNAQTGTAWELIPWIGRILLERAYIEPAAWLSVFAIQ